MMRTRSMYALSAFLTLVLASSAGADEVAIRKFVASYVEAFNGQDLKIVTAMWAESATHTDRETGERTEGRDAIVEDIAEAFKSQPEAKLGGGVERVQMIRPDVARVEGQTSIAAPFEDPALASFTAILVNEDGKWLIASIEESPLAQPTTAYDALQELEFLVGHWVDEGEGVRVDTTVRWTSNRAFLIRSFAAQDEAGVAHEGTQVIGWDPRSREIRSWSFNSDGSFGDGVWSKSGESWLIKSSQTLADGDAASGTYVLTRVDNDTLTMKLIGHEVEGEPQPAGAEVKVVRVADVEPAEDADDTATTEESKSEPAPSNDR